MAAVCADGSSSPHDPGLSLTNISIVDGVALSEPDTPGAAAVDGELNARRASTSAAYRGASRVGGETSAAVDDDDVEAGESFDGIAAAVHGADVVKLMLAIGDAPAGAVNVASSSGHSPLCLAASAGSAALLKVLLAAGADVHAVEPASRWTAMHCAVASRASESVKLLLEAGADPGVGARVDVPAVTQRPSGRRLPSTVAATTAGVDDPNSDWSATMTQWTPLHQLASMPDCSETAEFMRFLVSVGADVNVQSTHGITPLHVACLNESITLAQTLLQLGAQANDIAWPTDRTALHIACAQGNRRLVRVLLDGGADPCPPTDINGNGGAGVRRATRPVTRDRVDAMWASVAQRRRSDSATSQESKPRSQLADGSTSGPAVAAPRHCRALEFWSPLHLAACNVRGDAQVVVMLLEALRGSRRPAARWAVDRPATAHHKSPLCLAVMANRADIVRVLVDTGCMGMLSTRDADGRTPLHVIAACADDEDASEKTLAALLWHRKAGLVLNAVDSFGWTPLLVACHYGRPKLARLLCRAGADPNIVEATHRARSALHVLAATKEPAVTAVAVVSTASALVGFGADADATCRLGRSITSRMRWWEAATDLRAVLDRGTRAGRETERRLLLLLLWEFGGRMGGARDGVDVELPPWLPPTSRRAGGGGADEGRTGDATEDATLASDAEERRQLVASLPRAVFMEILAFVATP